MITFTNLNFTGSPDGNDTRAAKYIIKVENDRRAALDPPGTPLPDATGAEVKSSYLTILIDIISNAHTDYIRQAKEVVNSQLTTQEKQDLFGAVKDRLDSGTSVADLITDIQTP